MPSRGVLALVAVIVTVVGVGAYISASDVTSVSPSIPSSGETNSTSPSTTNSTSHYSSSGSSFSNRSLNAECSSLKAPTFGFGNLTAGTGSPTIICVQLYYHNQNATRILNLTDALSIQALQYVRNGSVLTPRSFRGDSNFTITASQPLIVLGGPADENEGTLIGFNITAKPGASGTYQLGFLSTAGLDGYMLASQGPESCGDYGQLSAGDGSPNYAQLVVHCITIETLTSTSYVSTTGSAVVTVSGSGPPPNGYLYFRVVGVTNSTG